MSLFEAETLHVYKVKEITTADGELNSFLYSLGCYPGEEITVIAKKKNGLVAAIKDGRYSLDNNLAKAIIVV